MKRVFALLLAAVLLLALIPFAGAYYSEEEKIEANKAAAAFAAEKGWLADGASRDTLTRAEAAKLVCVALEGKDKAEALTKTETGFADAPASLPEAKYIAYCAEKGLIFDALNDSFRPGEPMTAAGLARMLLVAFGFAKADDLKGDGWVVKTQKALRPQGLNWYLDTTADVPVTKECACQLAYNAWINAENAKIEPEAYKQTEIKFTDNTKYRLLGRAQQAEDGVVCNWAGDGVEFTISCKGLISLTVSDMFYSNSYPAFRVIVDGRIWDWMQVKRPGTRTCPAAVNIPAGEHTIRIIKDTAIHNGRELLISTGMLCKPETMKPTQPREKYIQVIGDSTSSGAGSYMPTDDMRTTIFTGSIVLSYGYMAAEELGWDYELNVKGSMGVVRKTGKPVEQNYATMYEYYNKYRDPEGKEVYPFPRKADVVTMKVSENDGKVPSEEWVPATLAFFETIRKYNGADVPIIVMYYSGSKHMKDIEKIIEEDPKIYGVKIKSNAGGAGGHPSPAAQVGYKDQLVEAIKQVVKS